MMTVSAVVGFVFALAFISMPEFTTLLEFPDAEGEALVLGITLRYILAGPILATAFLVIMARNVEGKGNQSSMLMGAGLGFASVCITLLLVMLNREAFLIPPIVATGVMASLCLWSRSKLS
jgi:membrane-associated phospholipid phosphatase